MSEPIEFPASLKAFCELVVERLGYANITHVLDVLDRNFAIVQDRRTLNCCFDQRLAWLVLAGEEGEGEAALVIVALILVVIVVFVAFSLARIAPVI